MVAPQYSYDRDTSLWTGAASFVEVLTEAIACPARGNFLHFSRLARTFPPKRSERAENQTMPQHIQQPTVIQAAGQPPKLIEEFVGRVNSKTSAASIARMTSPCGWSEPGQTPEFDEYTVVLRGTLHVKLKDKELDVEAGQAIIVSAGQWVQYSTPSPGGAEYIAVCLPAFSPSLVHRDEQ
jgi:ethanolamine utilization protein EutQ